MAVVLREQKAAVVENLRASRQVDDILSRLQANSWENQRRELVKLVESPNWKYGPAELLATFSHHLLVKSPAGEIVQVEWKFNPDDFNYELGRATVHKSPQPVSDLGFEVMETAKAAVDLILAEDFDGVQPMIASMAEALDARGDLQRQIQNDVTVRSLKRAAWWHSVVGERDGIEEGLPQPRTEGEDAIGRSIDDLLAFLKNAGRRLAESVRVLEARQELDRGVESLTQDIAEDVRRAIDALINVNRSDFEEAVQIYEAVMSAVPQLLNGIAYLDEVVAGAAEDTHVKN